MTIRFNIYYSVEKGQDIYLNILDGEQHVTSYKMGHDGYGNWTHELRMEMRGKTTLHYYYSLQEDATVLRTEWKIPHAEGAPSLPHLMNMGSGILQQYATYDTWIDEPIDAVFFTEHFTECLNKRVPQKAHQHPAPAAVRIKVFATQLRSNERLVLCGAHPVLGEWQPERGIPCHEQSPNIWYCDINTEYTANEELEYKFVAISKDGAAWEIGYNRTVSVPRIRKGEIVEYSQRPAAFERSIPRMAGTIYQSGKTLDTKKITDIIDWMADTEQRWLIVDTRHITKSNHQKEITAINDYARKQRVVVEWKVTAQTVPFTVWWDKDKERAEEYYREVLKRRDTVPHPLSSWLAHDIMMRQLLKPDTMLCLFTIEEWHALGDQKLLRNRDNIKEMLQESGRIY